MQHFIDGRSPIKKTNSDKLGGRVGVSKLQQWSSVFFCYPTKTIAKIFDSQKTSFSVQQSLAPCIWKPSLAWKLAFRCIACSLFSMSIALRKALKTCLLQCYIVVREQLLLMGWDVLPH